MSISGQGLINEQGGKILETKQTRCLLNYHIFIYFRIAPPTVSYKIHIENQSLTMDNVISRFPGLAEKIFDRLDDESLVNSRTVSRSWSEFTENEMFFLKRIIEKLIGDYEDFQETW